MPRRSPRCGSCARPGAACPSIARCAARGRSSMPSSNPSWRPRSRCSRCAATASTPPCCTPTSSCRCTPSASASTWRRVPGRSPPSRSVTAPTSRRLRRLHPDDVDYVAATVASGGRRAGHGDPGARLRRRPLHRRQLPRRGTPEPHVPAHQGAAAHRRGVVARADGRPRRDRRRVRRRPAHRRGSGVPAVRLMGRRRCPPPTTSASSCPTRGGCSPSSPSATPERPGSTSASAATTSSSRWPRPGPASSGWTGERRSPPPASGSATTWRSRATSTRRSSSPAREPALVRSGGRARRQRRSPGTHLQPRSRRPPRQRSRHPRRRRRLRPRGHRAVATLMTARHGVVVMAYGSPRRREEIAAYYTDIRRGRPPSAEQLADLTRRYDAIGGLSPLTRAHRGAADGDRRSPRAARRRAVRGRGRVAPRRAERSRMPSIGSPRDGVDGIVGLVLAPHYSTMSVAAYLERAGKRPAPHGLPFTGIESWATEPAYVDFLAPCRLGVAAGARRRRAGAVHGPLPAAADPRHRRSVPGRGRSDRPASSPTAAGLGGDRWAVAWQSAGRTAEPWLGPDLLGVDRRAGGSGTPTACWCARAGSSPTTSRCSTTSTSKPASAPRRRAGVPAHAGGQRRPRRDGRPRPTHRRRGHSYVSRDRRRRRRHRRARPSPNASRRRSATAIAVELLRGDRPARRQAAHLAVRRPAGGRRGRRRLPRAGARTARRSPGASGSARHSTSPAARAPPSGTDGLHRIPDGLLLGVPGDVAALATSRAAQRPRQAARRRRAAAAPAQGSRRLDRHARSGPLRRRGARAPRRRPRREHLRRRHRPLQPGDGAPARRAGRRTAQPAARGPTRAGAAAPSADGPLFYAPRRAWRRSPTATAAAAERPAPSSCDRRAGDLGRRRRSRWRVDDEPADVVVLATPAARHRPARRTRRAPDLAELLAAIGVRRRRHRHARRASTAARACAGRSGYLVPKPDQRLVTAVSFALAEVGALAGTAARSCACRSAVTACPSTTSTTPRSSAAAVDEVGRHLGLDLQPTAVRVTRWPRPFPQYRPGHLRLARRRRRGDAAWAVPHRRQLPRHRGAGVHRRRRAHRRPTCSATSTAEVVAASPSYRRRPDGRRMRPTRTVAGAAGAARSLTRPRSAHRRCSLGRSRSLDAVAASGDRPSRRRPPPRHRRPPSGRDGRRRPRTTLPPLPVPGPAPADNEPEPQKYYGRLQIPAIEVDSPFLEGIRLSTLDYGPGHWPGTAMPGELGNVVVAGHRTSHNADFRRLDELVARRPGDLRPRQHRGLRAADGVR